MCVFVHIYIWYRCGSRRGIAGMALSRWKCYNHREIQNSLPSDQNPFYYFVKPKYFGPVVLSPHIYVCVCYMYEYVFIVVQWVIYTQLMPVTNYFGCDMLHSSTTHAKQYSEIGRLSHLKLQNRKFARLTHMHAYIHTSTDVCVYKFMYVLLAIWVLHSIQPPTTSRSYFCSFACLRIKYMYVYHYTYVCIVCIYYMYIYLFVKHVYVFVLERVELANKFLLCLAAQIH